MICESQEVEMVKGNIGRIHVHLLVSVPPTMAVSKFVQRKKELTSMKLLMENWG
jgi:REP element-mobilizing transposase RayT